MSAEVDKPLRVGLQRLPHGAGLPLPHYATPGSAGLDLPAALPEDAPLTLPPGGRALVPAGFRLELPPGYEAQIRPRSGLALRHGVTVLNSPGTVDSDYRGEVCVLLVNLGNEAFALRRGDRMAQMVIAPVAQVLLVDIAQTGATLRGEGGYGSTGLREIGK